MFKQADAITYFRRHEGVVNHMYLDVVGLVTIGVGFMLPNSDAAELLSLVRRGDGSAATPLEKAQDWKAVHQCTAAASCEAYKPFTNLVLPESEIDRELAVRIQDFAHNLRMRFQRFDEFPDSVQLGLLDMVYSLGPRGFFSGYPKLCAAAEAQNWTACADESQRRNVSASRNQDLMKLFLDAAGR